ncbi:hypothetical protein [Arthrobacter mobilis]|uniref:Uncharacterized protein n=1 Tax=Arthrobacter mobilis TaxID=2724944 RepID=A0A7X6HF34_9MICC|nr:hypothetical protein [Arthrobacter mobilis]NKX55993.1 hypothetical protein [Arthrobacter mobilis]
MDELLKRLREIADLKNYPDHDFHDLRDDLVDALEAFEPAWVYRVDRSDNGWGWQDLDPWHIGLMLERGYTVERRMAGAWEPVTEPDVAAR